MEVTWLNELIAQVEIAKERSAKFYEKGNSSAGADVRKALQTIRGIAKVGRDDIQAVKTQRAAEKKAAKGN
jgi:hypothetical protein